MNYIPALWLKAVQLGLEVPCSLMYRPYWRPCLAAQPGGSWPEKQRPAIVGTLRDCLEIKPKLKRNVTKSLRIQGKMSIELEEITGWF